MDYALNSLGEKAIVVSFGNQINEAIHRKVVYTMQLLEENPVIGQIEVVPAFSTITIHYDPMKVWKEYNKTKISVSDVVARQLLDRLKELPQSVEKLQDYRQHIVIPICYGGEFGPDLNEVARYHQCSPEEIVSKHSQASYLVYMLGFSPGFPYLGGMDESIATPRRAVPRSSIPAGSIGIAGHQTGIYPIETPGGWQIIGRTPYKLFEPKKKLPVLIKPGDTITFKPISVSQFVEMSKERETWELK